MKPHHDLGKDDAASERELAGYEAIVFSFSDLVGSQPPLIGDCASLPHKKADILYAMKFVVDAYDTKREQTTNPRLADTYQRMIDTVNDLFTRLARDWQDIASEDKSAVNSLSGRDTFPDWALPLKLKYIDDERGSNEALDAAFKVLTDKVKRENSEGEGSPSLHMELEAPPDHANFVAGMRQRTITCHFAGEPFPLLTVAQKKKFAVLVSLYAIAPFALVPIWAYHEQNWWLLLGVAASLFGLFLGSRASVGGAKAVSGGFLPLLLIGLSISEGFRSRDTFYAFCATWSWTLYLVADISQRRWAEGNLVASREIYDHAIAGEKVLIIPHASLGGDRPYPTQTRLVTILRWIAVLPSFLAAAMLTGLAWLLLTYVSLSLPLVRFGLPNPGEVMHFHSASDMDGQWIDGTIWLFLKYAIALASGMLIAVRVAPHHRVATAWALTALTALVMLLGVVASAQGHHSFSSWYRWIVEFLAILLGCGFGIREAVLHARPERAVQRSTTRPDA